MIFDLVTHRELHLGHELSLHPPRRQWQRQLFTHQQTRAIPTKRCPSWRTTPTHTQQPLGRLMHLTCTTKSAAFTANVSGVMFTLTVNVTPFTFDMTTDKRVEIYKLLHLRASRPVARQFQALWATDHSTLFRQKSWRLSGRQREKLSRSLWTQPDNLGVIITLNERHMWTN